MFLKILLIFLFNNLIANKIESISIRAGFSKERLNKIDETIEAVQNNEIPGAVIAISGMERL